ncbi:hypothetical protein [Leuconostoc suionicum]|uniref:hypothetical protein n=1 Tax=Leuconostoc suionicum TaxID=1511761 RepID=UPI00233E69B8|nr:hypothetical protein [Leuconostoc suionicum]MDC2804850.1 hypothetical protein [Leuconostoc suionicum]MDC2822362.1 hypothetical protein [Leuconostoc suionicum]
MNILYKLYNVNNLSYKFDNSVIKGDNLDETYELNMKGTAFNINKQNNIAIIKLNILVNSLLNESDDVFRTLSFDYNHVYKINDYESMSDDEIRDFVIKHGLENAMSSVKDVIKRITDIDYQGRMLVDIPEFPLNVTFDS